MHRSACEQKELFNTGSYRKITSIYTLITGGGLMSFVYISILARIKPHHVLLFPIHFAEREPRGFLVELYKYIKLGSANSNLQWEWQSVCLLNFRISFPQTFHLLTINFKSACRRGIVILHSKYACRHSLKNCMHLVFWRREQNSADSVHQQ